MCLYLKTHARKEKCVTMKHKILAGIFNGKPKNALQVEFAADCKFRAAASPSESVLISY